MLEGGGDNSHMVRLDVLTPALKQLPRLGVQFVEWPVREVGWRCYAHVAEEDGEHSYSYDYMRCADLGGKGFQSGHYLLGVHASCTWC